MSTVRCAPAALAHTLGLSQILDVAQVATALEVRSQLVTWATFVFSSTPMKAGKYTTAGQAWAFRVAVTDRHTLVRLVKVVSGPCILACCSFLLEIFGLGPRPTCVEATEGTTHKTPKDDSKE